MKNTENKETTEQQILAAAKEVFQIKGMEGARMQEIADAAGINKAMLHYYYKSKEMLFQAVFKSAFLLLAPQLNAILNDDSSVEDKIKNFTINYTNFMTKHPYLPNFIFQELNRKEDFILKLKENTGFPNLTKFQIKVEQEINQGILNPIAADQLFVNIVALNIFPFLGKPLIKAFVDKDDKTFEEFVEIRKIEVANFIINSIKRH